MTPGASGEGDGDAVLDWNWIAVVMMTRLGYTKWESEKAYLSEFYDRLEAYKEINGIKTEETKDTLEDF